MAKKRGRIPLPSKGNGKTVHAPLRTIPKSVNTKSRAK